ncbi:hypothetical protein USDA257_c11500 [Sinorhizobium fredii USDA 257]|uniref:Uncharacterized protein n=1 Tax=Sinorhizobium fredii (strain USDA 257) TaxID=1185652 RepID=I3X1I5_SINF2|nr:hypothetical protein USDA257_c11500 [Sinorhizobium fredii USDA 257]
MIECHGFIPFNQVIIGIVTGPRSDQEPMAIQIFYSAL